MFVQISEKVGDKVIGQRADWWYKGKVSYTDHNDDFTTIISTTTITTTTTIFTTIVIILGEFSLFRSKLFCVHPHVVKLHCKVREHHLWGSLDGTLIHAACEKHHDLHNIHNFKQLPHLQQSCASAQPCCLDSPLACHCKPDGDDMVLDYWIILMIISQPGS